MSINSFTYNGVSSEDMGLYVGGQKTFGAPQRDVTKVSIPGRNGDLVRDNGRFLNSEIAYNIVAMDDFKETAQNVRNWLMSAKGYKRLEDTYHPEHYRMARVSDAIDFETGAYNATGKAQILFDCMPQRFLKSGEEISDASMVDHTESGDMLSFETVAEDDMTKVEVAITPVQSLNGYDHPWAGGAGKNKITSQTIYQNGNNYYVAGDSNSFPIYLTAGTYTLSSEGVGAYAYWRKEGTSANNVIHNSSTNIGTFTIADDANYRIWFYQLNVTADDFTKIQVEQGSFATDWTPYENLCPITGWTAANVYSTGVNVWDEVWEVGSYNSGISTVQKYNDSTHIRSKNPISVKPNKTYYMNTAGYSVHLIVADLSGNVLYRSTSLNNGTFTTPNDSAYAYFNMAQAYGTTYNNDISINYPSSNTAYAPYSGNSVTFSFGQTVYKGEVNAKAGTVTETWGNIASYAGETLTGEWISDRDVYTSGGTPTTGAQVVYELASPQTISVTPQSLSTLVGTNNVWADCGDTEIEYAEPGVIENPTPFESKPLIRVYGSGTCTVTINNQIITINNVTDFVDIDCETMNCYNGVVNKNADVVLGAQGFPVLPAGVTMIKTGGGTTKVEITPRWWEL